MGSNNKKGNGNDTTARIDEDTHQILVEEKKRTGKPIKRLVSDAVKASYLDNTLED